MIRRPSVLGGLVVAVLALVAVKLVVAEPFSIPTASMAPTLKAGDHVLVNKLAYRTGHAQRGDLAVLRAPGTREIVLKRVVGVAGDRVEIRDGTLFVNARAQREPWVVRRDVDSVYFGPVRVPRGDVFVLGDNRGDSIDSRQLGPLRERDAIGRVDLRLWPLSALGHP